MVDVFEFIKEKRADYAGLQERINKLYGRIKRESYGFTQKVFKSVLIL